MVYSRHLTFALGFFLNVVLAQAAKDEDCVGRLEGAIFPHQPDRTKNAFIAQCIHGKVTLPSVGVVMDRMDQLREMGEAGKDLRNSLKNLLVADESSTETFDSLYEKLKPHREIKEQGIRITAKQVFSLLPLSTELSMLYAKKRFIDPAKKKFLASIDAAKKNQIQQCILDQVQSDTLKSRAEVTAFADMWSSVFASSYCEPVRRLDLTIRSMPSIKGLGYYQDYYTKFQSNGQAAEGNCPVQVNIDSSSDFSVNNITLNADLFADVPPARDDDYKYQRTEQKPNVLDQEQMVWGTVSDLSEGHMGALMRAGICERFMAPAGDEPASAGDSH